MAVLNLRGVPDNLAAKLKSEAALGCVGYHQYCLCILERRDSAATIEWMLSVIEKVALASSKKIADISGGGETTEGGGTPDLSPLGKAQDERVDAIAFSSVEILASSPEELEKMKEEAKTDRHTASVLHFSGVSLDREILVRWGLAENYKPKLEEKNGSEKVVEGNKNREGRGPAKEDRRASKGLPKDNDGGKGAAVATGKPTVAPEVVASLRDICAGNLQPLALAGDIPDSLKPLDNPADYAEVDLCGFQSYNDTDGENYVCGKEKHGPKVKHGDWIKV